MKRYLFVACLVLSAALLVSWGRTGHSTIGLIATNHLDVKAKAGVAALLGGESLADVASWADDNRTSQTAPGILLMSS